MRVCPGCGPKPDEAFYENVGKIPRCRDCMVIYRAAYRKRRPAQAAWHCINSRAGNRFGDHPAYTHVEVRMGREEFISWYDDNFLVGCSVDRIDSTGHYELSNLQMVPLVENTTRTSKNKRPFSTPGMTWCSSCSTELPLSSFYRNSSVAYGKQHICKTCTKKRNDTDEQRKQHREYMQEYRKKKVL